MIGFKQALIVLGANSPAMILWVAVIIFAAVRLRRGGGRAERFLLAGGIIKLAGVLLSIPSVFIPSWLAGMGYDVAVKMNSIYPGYGIFLKVISMAGIICLLYAFWVKFKERNNGAAPELAPQD